MTDRETGGAVRGRPCVGGPEIWIWGCAAGEGCPAGNGPLLRPRPLALACWLGASLAWAMARACRGVEDTGKMAGGAKEGFWGSNPSVLLGMSKIRGDRGQIHPRGRLGLPKSWS